MKPVDMASDGDDEPAETHEIKDDLQRYPWGLCITLTEEELEKLKIDDLPELGAQYELCGMAKVVSVSSSSTMLSENSTLRLQITQFNMQPARKGTAAKLYKD